MSGELPWPKPGSSILAVRRNGHGCACLRWAQGQWYGYEEGYRRAAHVLYEHIAATSTGMDTLVFPLIYLWRHAIELQLKKVIANGRRLRDVVPHIPKTHDLVRLWKLAQTEITALDEAVIPETEVVDHVLDELQQLDPEATGFRHPEDNKGQPNLTSPPSLLDLDNVQEILTDVHTFLECANAEISQRLEWMHEMAAQEERLYREH
jgi:hypothetical protein